MQLTAVFLVGICLQVAATGISQTVTFSGKDVPLEKLFAAIKQQTGYLISYKVNQVSNASPVSVHAEQVSLEDFLRTILRDQTLEFAIEVNTIFIKKKEEPARLVRPVQTFMPVPPADVKGKVVDDKGEPVVASVMVKGTNKGVTTDANGEFSIPSVDNNATLVISGINIETREIKVNGRSSISIVVQKKIDEEKEVVVALGITRKAKSLVYSTQVIKAEQLSGVRDANNIINSFQGKIANATITQGSGGVGSGARIVLRGNRSIQGSSGALFVVDGVPILNSSNSAAASDYSSIQGSDGASNINPDDIESVTVLPGATAAALYGSDAGNGVVVITTKKGKKDKMAVTINSGAVMESAFALPRVQNTYGQGFSGNITGSGSSWGAKMTGQTYTNYLGKERKYSPQPDNISDFFNKGLSLNNSIGITGGTEKAQMYLSYTNNEIQGIVPNNTLQRHTANFRITSQLSKRFSTDAKITYMLQNVKHRPRAGETNSPILDIYQIPRSVSLDDAKDYQVLNDEGVYKPQKWPVTPTNIYQNPYWVVNNTSINEERSRIWGFLSAKYKFTNWLSITGRANLDRTTDNREDSYAAGTAEFAPYVGGYFGIYNQVAQQKWFDLMLSGNNKITKDLRVDYNVGAIYKRLDNKSLDTRAFGLNIPNRFNLNFATTQYYEEARYAVETQSVFGQVNFSFKDAVFLDASLRNDWTSTLPAPHSFQYYSVGASAIISDLVTLPTAFSFLKASASYAKVGNGGRFGLLVPTYLFTKGGPNGYLNRDPVFPIPGLKPELVTNQEVALEGMFLNNRIGFTATLYKTVSTNQLLTIDLPPATGYSTKYINAGNIQNQGFEFTFKASPVRHKDLSWDVALNFSLNRNKVKELADGVSEFSLATAMSGRQGRAATPKIKVGGSYGDLYAYKWATDAKGNHLVQPASDAKAGRPVITKKQEYIGNFNAKENIGLTNSITYKRFFASILVDGRIGGIMVSGTEMNLAFSGIPEVTEKFREGGLSLGGKDVDGNPVSTAISAQDFWQTASAQRYGQGEFFAYDATNIRVRELSLGYDFRVGHNSFIKAVNLSAVARNLFWIYRGSSILDIPGIGKRKMWFDPDMSIGNSNFQGVDYGTMPSTRSVGVNLKLNF